MYNPHLSIKERSEHRRTDYNTSLSGGDTSRLNKLWNQVIQRSVYLLRENGPYCHLSPCECFTVLSGYVGQLALSAAGWNPEEIRDTLRTVAAVCLLMIDCIDGATESDEV